MTVAPAVYRGRFAPTPSGPLHFGSLVTALGSYLDARAHDGAWLVRIEDLDTPRIVPGAADAILGTLEAHGFEWDGPVMRQSQRGEAYAAVLDRLCALELVYACACSRKHIAEHARQGIDGPVYPGTCRVRRVDRLHASPKHTALRLEVPDRRLGFVDLEQGRVACDVARECGDFVLRRADDVFTYHLAVTIDDADQGITDIVRGADLLASTPRHILLQWLLGFNVPNYRHLSVVLDAQGDKLSKQTLATPVDPKTPIVGLVNAAAFLGLPGAEAPDSLDAFWRWAIEAWKTRLARPVRGCFWQATPNPCKP